MPFFAITVTTAENPKWQSEQIWEGQCCSLAVQRVIDEYRKHGMYVQILSAKSCHPKDMTTTAAPLPSTGSTWPCSGNVRRSSTLARLQRWKHLGQGR